MCLCACLWRLGLRFVWSVFFFSLWWAQIKSTTEARMAKHNLKLSLLIPVWLARFEFSSYKKKEKTGRSKGSISRFMSTISHNEWEKCLKTWEKVSNPMCFCWSCVDLTDASGFNGVEQCEKCLSQPDSKVHHATFMWFCLSLSAFFLSFSPIIPHCFSHRLSELIYVYVLRLFYVKVSSLTENSAVSFCLAFHHSTAFTCCCSSVSLCTKLIKP